MGGWILATMKSRAFWIFGIVLGLGYLATLPFTSHRPATSNASAIVEPTPLWKRGKAGGDTAVAPPSERSPSPRPALAENPKPAETATLQNELESSQPTASQEGLSRFSFPTDAAGKEQLGRMALSFVGADPVADDVWISLINDPTLPANVRQDLIEDLNENGFSDGNGRRPTVDDLSLIESRMQLIEEHAQDAMDDVNAAAFAEAYKDLANMWLRLTSQ